MDKKVRELIEPFKNWNIEQLSFERVMTTIDAIVESKCKTYVNKILKQERVKNSLKEITDDHEEINDEKSREKHKNFFRLCYYTNKNDLNNMTLKIKTRNTLKELFSEVIMTITNEKEVNENFTYSKCDLRTLKKNIRKYIRNLICEISDSEPLYIYSNYNKCSTIQTSIEHPLVCYHARNYKILLNNTINNNYLFGINIECINYSVIIPITFYDGKNTYFLSVRNEDSENKSYNFAIVNIKTKEFIVFTKDKYVFDDWKLEITAKH